MTVALVFCPPVTRSLPFWSNVAVWNLRAVVIAAFAALVLTLAVVGVFGVLAYTVQQRVREFGVRIALGAPPAEVSRLVLRQASVLAATGAAFGLAGAIAVARGIESLLYGVSPRDPISFAAAAALLFIVALLAGYGPARRAALSNPAHALRAD